MSLEEKLFQKFGREFPAGTILFREADTSREMYVINSGKVRISKQVRGQEKALATLGGGEFFGEMAVLNNKLRSATATVIEDSRILVIEPKTFEAMIKGSTEIALRMIKRMAARLQEADDHIENLMLRDPASRVVHFIVRQSRIYGSELTWTPSELPSQIGVEDEEITKVGEKLAKKKLANFSDAGITVLDAKKLEQYLEFLAMREQFGDDS